MGEDLAQLFLAQDIGPHHLQVGLVDGACKAWREDPPGAGSLVDERGDALLVDEVEEGIPVKSRIGKAGAGAGGGRRVIGSTQAVNGSGP